MPDAPWVIDGHNDLPWAMRDLNGYDLDTADLVGVPALQTDLPRLRRGGVGAQFWSVFVPVLARRADAVTATLEQIDFVHAMVDALPRRPRARHDARRSRGERSASGRIASLMGMEGGHSIDELARRPADDARARRPLPDPHPQRERRLGRLRDRRAASSAG